ncbi:MAG TPA: hypothetical protein VEH55_08385 [Gaiellaceae bacterium]|nr:hypothetical protein [Gaiellaceae bacterium]
MLKGVVAVAVVIVAVMVGIRNGYILHTAGLGGSCTLVQRLADGSQWVACQKGEIGGWPDLTRHNCTSSGVTGTSEYWKCPADLVDVNP